MKRTTGTTLSRLALCAGLATAPFMAFGEDIDIFTGASAGVSLNPRILVVLDNTSNWSRASQKWPDAPEQGMSEVHAIQSVVNDMDSSISIGLMEFVTGGNANQDGGFIRYNIRDMTDANKAVFSATLDTIYDNITNPNEKRNANTPYGNLMYDVYNYFASANSYSPGGVVTSLADADGYSSMPTTFKSVLNKDNTCGKNYMIFIGNPNSSGPTVDDPVNLTKLAELGGATAQLGLPDYKTEVVTTVTTIGKTAACYANATAAVAALPAFAATCADYSGGCKIGGPVSSSGGISCPTGTQGYQVTQTVVTPPAGGVTTTIAGPAVVTAGTTTGYYANAAAANSDRGNLSCPTTTSASAGLATIVTSYACTYTYGAAIGGTAATSSTAQTTDCYSTSGACPKSHASLTCPTYSTCAYTAYKNSGAKGACSGSDRTCTVTQTATPSAWRFAISRSMVTTTATTVGGSGGGTPTNTVLGFTSQCYAAAPLSTSDYAQCSAANASCSYGPTTTSTVASCAAGTSLYAVQATDAAETNTPLPTTTVDSNKWHADEWARFLHDVGIPVPGTTIKPNVTTYTIDVYNKQQNADHTRLLLSMARAGGGKYFAAKSEQAIIDAFRAIVAEIQAVNSSFASTSLPVNATNRSQNENQVFIGMFRPDPVAKPRWYGNIKRYQLISVGSAIELGDAAGGAAVNTTTGFVTPCASSYWSEDTTSPNYWQGRGVSPDPISTCTSSTTIKKYADKPDGPMVEKGAAAQMLRQQATRTVYTHSGGLVPISAGNTGLDATLVEFMKGYDVDAIAPALPTDKRDSIHGDVIHSRPLPINKGGAVTVYYGANDGALHAVNANTGVERWAFIAPEFMGGGGEKFSRLRNNYALVKYENRNDVGAMPKDYFFDGSTGLYQNGTNSQIWIYPTMRRGGNMIYSLDVTNPDSPSYKWKAGCDGAACTTGMSNMGQSWSTPQVAFIKQPSGAAKHVVVVGGGYDKCEDEDTASPSCGATKGNSIYVLDAATGEKLAEFPTTRGVAADIALVDLSGDGKPDYAFAADLGGALYRIDFVEDATSLNALAPTDWKFRKIAATTTGFRKFLFAPSVLSSALNKVVYIAIGSGDREHPLATDYPYTKPVTNRFYVYKDNLLVNAASTPVVDLDSPTVMENFTADPGCTAAGILPDSTTKVGWYMDLGVGEQVVTASLITGGMATFSTNKPVPPASGTCATSLGEARGYWLNLLNGSGGIGPGSPVCGGARSSTFVGGGLPPTPVLAVGVPINGRATSVVIGAAQREGGASVVIQSQKDEAKPKPQRRKIYQYTSGN